MLRMSSFSTRNPVLVNQIQSRTFKSDLKIKWVRPVKIPCIDPVKSGDLKPKGNINIKDLPPNLAKSEELKNAGDLVKRLFTLEFLPKSKGTKMLRNDMINSVRRHQSDWGSMECRIARMTADIRSFQDAFTQRPLDRKLKVKLKELIDKRKKYLKFLRRSDYKRFEWLLEKLDLQYRPPPSHFHWITRKESLQKLTDKYCEDIKEERLKAYKEQLESQKIDFLREKINKLQWIIKEEEECGIEPTVTESDVEIVIHQLKELELEKQETLKEERDDE